MSTPTSSREPPAPVNHQMTLAALRERVVADATLTARQRQDIASALRSLGKALQMPLERLWCTNRLMDVERQLSPPVRRYAAIPACRAGSSG